MENQTQSAAGTEPAVVKFLGPQAHIDAIDLLIDANRRALMARLHVNPDCSARVWQNAWDRCPDLRARDTELFRERGAAQQQRDQEAERAWKIEQRRERAKFKKRAA